MYCSLATLFDFPGPTSAAQWQDILALLRERYPTAATELQAFLGGIPPTLVELQELHTRTFDVQAITTLDIGYLLFGDDYKRAELLSHLTREHRDVDNHCRGELADHLPNVLRLLPCLTDHALRIELVTEILVPALLLMIREFDPERIGTKSANYQKHYRTLIATAPGPQATIYSRALQTLLEVLQEDFPVRALVVRLSQWSQQSTATDAPNLLCRQPAANFSDLITKELEIETHANPTNSGCDS